MPPDRAAQALHKEAKEPEVLVDVLVDELVDELVEVLVDVLVDVLVLDELVVVVVGPVLEDARRQ
eukprot:3752730-Amphidinium_carterae.1